MIRGGRAVTPRELEDAYRSDLFRWWHLSRASPELELALAEHWLAAPSRVLDLGCGLGTEVAALGASGFAAVGVDAARTALVLGRGRSAGRVFVRADVRRLPFLDGAFDAALDRGCFHYLRAEDRPLYQREARRVLKPGGRLLLRACLRSAGVRNDLDEDVLRAVFRGWTLERLERQDLPSDTRTMPALVARLRAP